MKGTGKTLREQVEAGYLWHTKEAYLAIMGANGWPWGKWWDALTTLATIPIVLACVALFPITVPLAGYTRMREAKKAMERAEGYKSRMSSRTQRV